MAETVTLTQFLVPNKAYVAPEISKVTKQIILVKKEDIEFKVEIDNKLEDLDYLPLTLGRLVEDFRITSVDSAFSLDKLSKIFNLMSGDHNRLKKELNRIAKKIYAERLSKKIDLKKYQLSRIYLMKFKDYFEFINSVFKKIFNTKDQAQIFRNTVLFEEKFARDANNYVISYLTFFCLLFCLQKKKKIFRDALFSRIQLYDRDLAKKHYELMQKLSS